MYRKIPGFFQVQCVQILMPQASISSEHVQHKHITAVHSRGN